MKRVKANARIYPLSAAANPPAQTFVNMSGLQFNTIHANDFHFYEELNAVVQARAGGRLRSRTGRTVRLDRHQEGQAVRSRCEDESNPHRRRCGRQRHGARDPLCVARRAGEVLSRPPVVHRFHRQAATRSSMRASECSMRARCFTILPTGITPAMAAARPGSGSAYAIAARDSQGRYFDGGKTYKVTLPAPVPAGQFWSFTVYDNQTRSMLETDQALAGLDSTVPGIKNKRRWLGDGMVRPERARRTGGQLGANQARQGLEHPVPALRAATALVRQELEARRLRAGGVSEPDERRTIQLHLHRHKRRAPMSTDQSDLNQQGNSFEHTGDIKRRDVLLCGSALLTATALSGTLLPGLANAQVPKPGVDPTPGFNNKIPEKILTPDTVETRIGTLNFVDGVPTAETTQRVYDTSTSCAASRSSSTSFPPRPSKRCAWASPKWARPRATRPSSSTSCWTPIRCSSPETRTPSIAASMLDLETDGPTVVEVPPGSGPGTVNDAFFRFVVDMGGPGPDQGKGGKYLIVPADYKGELPKDVKDGGEYFIARSPSYVNWLILRGFLVDGKPDAASKMFREGVKVYPLSKAGNPPTMEFINGSKVPFNTDPRQQFRVLPGARSRDPEGAGRSLRSRAARARRLHRHPQGHSRSRPTSG